MVFRYNLVQHFSDLVRISVLSRYLQFLQPGIQKADITGVAV
jgi:hypothetical protein